jgi:hypothetical protein
MTPEVVARSRGVSQMSARDDAPRTRMVTTVCGQVGNKSTAFPNTWGRRGNRLLGQNVSIMATEPYSPELALVDPELGARARAALPSHPWPAPRRAARPEAATAPEQVAERVEVLRTYPAWARVTAALWLVVIGILIGGTAIPHAQDKPRVVPPSEEVPTNCERPETPPPTGVRAP